MAIDKQDARISEALSVGLKLMTRVIQPIIDQGDDRAVINAMNAANDVQAHYRKALRCPVCEDSACETKSAECGR